MNISKTQKAVLEEMADGWELIIGMIFDKGVWLQKGSLGKDRVTKTVRSATFTILYEKQLITQAGGQSPLNEYKLTDKAIDVLNDENKALKRLLDTSK